MSSLIERPFVMIRRSLLLLNWLMAIVAIHFFVSCKTTAQMAAVVHVKTFDETGPRPYRVTRFADAQTGKDYSKSFNGLEAKDVPYGQYDYVLNRSDINDPRLSTIRGRLYVNRPEHWLELNPSGIYESSGRHEVIQELDGQQDVPILGTLIPPPQPEVSVWVRVEAVHSRDRETAGVDRKGEFRIYGRLWGWYVVMVLEEGKLIHSEPLYVADSKDLERLVVRLRDR